MSYVDYTTLWNRWSDLWNGDLALADQIIAPDFVAHFVPLTGGIGNVHGPHDLQQWIRTAQGLLPDLSFMVHVGPIIDGNMVVGRWNAIGTYQGSLPGTPASVIGKRVTFTGTDILRVENGQFVEYWANADSLDLMQQLGVVPLLG
jgi:predicted ester cyclase